MTRMSCPFSFSGPWPCPRRDDLEPFCCLTAERLDNTLLIQFRAEPIPDAQYALPSHHRLRSVGLLVARSKSPLQAGALVSG